MQLQLLGTGARDGQEYDPQDKETRGNASALFDEKILIDCGPAIPFAFEHYGTNIEKITDILLTHSHMDHCDFDSLRYLINKRISKEPICLWASVELIKQVKTLNLGLALHPLAPGDEFVIDSLKVTALEANHQTHIPDEKALHYFFETAQNRTFLYATDGAWFLKPTWLFLKEHKIDLIVWDFTIGDTSGDFRIFEHNSLDMIKVMTETFRKNGVFSDETQVILSHMARTLCSPHKQLQKKLDPFNFNLAFDGMVVTI
jgi:adenosylcobinamide kinase/adenosylcobinamide-phosphate guanylyltransferase